MGVPPPQERYARQRVLKEIGEAGQQKLAAATAVILGVGALGSGSAGLLARAGVGTLRIVDRDFVDWTNLQRQCLFEEDDAARWLPKAEAAVQHLHRINSAIHCEAVIDDINAGTVERLITGATVVVDGLDSFHTRALVNQACVKRGIPWIYGACLGTCGNAASIIPGTTACLHCMLPEVEQATTPPLTCETVGVLGPVSAFVASWQAAEALKVITGQLDAVSRDLVHFDLWHNDLDALPMQRNAACSVCARHEFGLLEHGDRLASATLCGRDAMQILPPVGFDLDFDLLARTLGRLFTLEQNSYLLKFRTDGHDVVVFHDGRAMVFGTSDAKQALSIYGKYVGG